jgi:hypothetical protein
MTAMLQTALLKDGANLTLIRRHLYHSDMDLRQRYGSGGKLVNGVDGSEKIPMNEDNSRCSQPAED